MAGCLCAGVPAEPPAMSAANRPLSHTRQAGCSCTFRGYAAEQLAHDQQKLLLECGWLCANREHSGTVCMHVADSYPLGTMWEGLAP